MLKILIEAVLYKLNKCHYTSNKKKTLAVCSNVASITGVPMSDDMDIIFGHMRKNIDKYLVDSYNEHLIYFSVSFWNFIDGKELILGQ